MPSHQEIADENRILKMEVARLRVAASHLIVHSRAVLACVESGALASVGHDGQAYQTSQAVSDLDATLARAVSGRWRPLTDGQIGGAWCHHRERSIFRDYMTRAGFEAAVHELFHFSQVGEIEQADKPLSQRARHEHPQAFQPQR